MALFQTIAASRPQTERNHEQAHADAIMPWLRLLARSCDVPIAIVSARPASGGWEHHMLGIAPRQINSIDAFHSRTLRTSGLFSLSDLTTDVLLSKHPLVTGQSALRFYAGITLTRDDGSPLGIVAIMDDGPRILNDEQKEAIQTIAQGVAVHLAGPEKAIAQDSGEETVLLGIARELTRIGTWQADVPEGNLIWSEEISALMGIPSDMTLTVEQCFHFCTPQYRDQARAAYNACVSHGMPVDMEMELVTFSGRHIWVRSLMRPVYDNKGTIVRIQGAVMDITEKKHAELELKRSEQQFRELADSMPHIVWTAQPDGRVDYVNKIAAAYVSLDSKESLHWADYLHPADVDRCRAMWRHTVATGGAYTFEYRLYHVANKEYRWHLASAKPVRDASGKIIKWYGTCIDIHHRKQNDEKLEQLTRS